MSKSKDIIIEALENLAKDKTKENKKLKNKVLNQSIEIEFLLGFINHSSAREDFLDALDSAEPNNGYISAETIHNWLSYVENENSFA
jgi:hypothetical protein